jgi:hypothetical protein
MVEFRIYLSFIMFFKVLNGAQAANQPANQPAKLAENQQNQQAAAKIQQINEQEQQLGSMEKQLQTIKNAEGLPEPPVQGIQNPPLRPVEQATVKNPGDPVDSVRKFFQNAAAAHKIEATKDEREG